MEFKSQSLLVKRYDNKPAIKEELYIAIASKYLDNSASESSFIRANAIERHANIRFHTSVKQKAIQKTDDWAFFALRWPKTPPKITAKGTEYIAINLPNGDSNSSA